MRVVEVFFSPTGGTRRAADVVAGALARNLDLSAPVSVDLTGADADGAQVELACDDVVLLAAPAFAGRVPAVAAERFSQLRGGWARAVLVCSYGNRAFEDTLVELQDLAEAADLFPVAGVAAVTEHSIARQFGTGRPDADDELALTEFAARIAEKIAGLSAGERPAALELPGNRPYKQASPAGPVPAATPDCVGCGVCARSCPVGAIDASDPTRTDAELCISCMRCVSVCPSGARRSDASVLAALGAKLEPLCARRKDPELFL